METLSAPLKNKKLVKLKKRAAWLQTFAKAQVLKKLAKLTHGQLTLIDDGELYQFGGLNNSNPNSGISDLTATITVNDAHFYGDIAFGAALARAKLTCWAIGRRIISPT